MTDRSDPWGEGYWPAVWADDMKNIRGLGPFYFVLHKQRTEWMGRAIRRMPSAEVRARS
jgi:hypothetical protein